MELSFLVTNLLLIILTVISSYIFLRILFRKSILGNYDPLHVGIILLSFYSIFFTLPFYFPVGPSFWIISSLIVLYLLAASLPGCRKINKAQFLKIGSNAQVFLALLILTLLLSNFIFNTMMGPIPLFMDEGVHVRYLMNRNNRVLAWLTAGLFSLPLILICLSDIKKVKIISIFSLFLVVLTEILSASKGSFLLIIIYVINYIFLLRLRGRVPSPLFKKIAFSLVLSIILIFPIFLVKIGFSGNPADGVKGLLVRLAGGFDQLIYIVINDIPLKDYGLSLLKIYFAPFIKPLGMELEYNTSIEYLGVNFLGWEDTERMMPNCNLVIDAVFTNGILVGSILIFLIGLLGFGIRRICIQKKGLRVYDLILFQFFVISPFYWFLDGQRFVASMISSVIFYCLFLILYNAPWVLVKRKLVAW